MRNIIIAILLFTATYASAQIPGYQGLRFSVKYNCGINHPAVVGRSGKLPMLYHNGSMEYVITRAWSIGARYGFMTYNSPAIKKLINDEYYNYDLNINDYKGRYTQHVVALYGKYYFKKRGFIAPVGPYITIGGYYQYGKNTLWNAAYNTDYNYNTSLMLTKNRITSQYGGITFGMGRNFVIANRLIIDLGFDLNITFPNPTILGGDKVEQAAFNDLLLRNLFQLHLGIGVLAF